jgi:prepilin-type N-terminal cleavage/methylation domain-containing protein/prepilin-type processing-associated H-X9-DG protein
MFPFRTTTGFSLLELLVCVALIAVLAALAIPVHQRVLANGRTAECAAMLRQLGTAAIAYAADHDLRLPGDSHSGNASWSVALKSYAGGNIVFTCPVDERKRPYTYLINDFLTPAPAGAPNLDFSRLPSLERPGETVLFAEASAAYTGSNHFHFSDYAGYELPAEVFEAQVAVTRHGGSANYLFADGSLRTLTRGAVRERLARAGDRFLDPTR